jgi:hypothetical protein
MSVEKPSKVVVTLRVTSLHHAERDAYSNEQKE